MAKKQTPGQQNSSSKEIKQANPSPMTAEHASRTGLRTASNIDPRKIKPDDPADESTAIMEDGSVPSPDQAADTAQPVLVAQLNDAGSAGGGGTAIVPDAGNATDQNMVLAMADGVESGSGRVSSNDAPASGGMNGWWLVGGLAAVGIGGAIAASGGSSGGSGTTAATVSGTVTDGPVEGARLYYDINANGIYDEGTDTAVLDANGQQVVTDELGNFNFTTTQNVATIRLVTAGGTDTVTGETVTLNFSAPAGYTQINPITSAIAAYMEANPEYTAAQAETAVETALGLPDLDFSTMNLADPPAELAAADVLAAQQAAAILATTAIVIAQSGADADAFQYVAENMGSGGSTSALVTAVQEDPNVDQSAADQLAETVAAVEAATSLDAIGEALNDTFFAEVTTSGTVSVGQTLTGELGLGNTTGFEVTYQWQSSADGTTWTDIAGATGTSYQLTSDEAGDHIRLKAVYTDTAGVAQTVYSSDMGVVPVPNVPPALGDYTVALAENSADGTAVQTVAATDADNDTLSYAITAGNASGAFAINSATGAITVADSSKLDFETTTSFNLTVEANDGTVTDSGTVTVNLTNVNDNTPVITSGGTGSVAENAATGTIIYDAAATDADAGTTLVYSLKGATGDVALLNIDSSTGAVTLKNSADFETKTTYTFTVVASDGTNSSEQAITVSVTNVNETPSITSNGGGASASLTIAENVTSVTTVTATDIDAGDSKTFSITGGADQALFAIDSSTGALTFLAAPDFEAPADAGGNNVYDVQVTVTDSGGLTDVQDLAVTVTNVNEHFIVERTGVWFDVDADGFRDADETTAADFTPGIGNVDLSAIPAVIHFNNVPSGDISLAGFGADDLIEIDIQSFIDNGHNAFQILTQPNIVTLDEFSGYAQSSAGSTGNSLVAFITGTGTNVNVTGTRYLNFNSYSATSGSTRTATVGLTLRTSTPGLRRLSFISNNGSSSTNVQLASQLTADMPLQEMVDFVNLPTPPIPVHVVVERDGAFIDLDGDGILDNGENRLAGFGVGGSADLANKSVVIHFTDAPQSALNLTGFGEDDKVEIDVAALQANGVLSSTAANAGIVSITIGAGAMRGYNFMNTTGTSSRNFRILVNQHGTYGGQSTSLDFNGTAYSGAFGLSFSGISSSISGRTQGLVAYWTDTSNALNIDGNLLPDLVTTPTSNQAAVVANLNANHYPGLVEFVWPVHVVVDDEAGNVASFIDANSNGVRDFGENTLALLGQTEADVVAFNAAAETNYGSQAVNLATEQVTIHYNDLPTDAWMPDLTGFGGNDRIEIDIPALRNNLTVVDSVVRSNQNSRTTSSQTYAGVSGVTSGGNAIYISSGNLYFGHRASSPTSTGSFAGFSSFYTATGALEGMIAANGNVLAGDFQPVIFVTEIM